LALTAEEGRGKLRKAAGKRKLLMIRRCPNGETRLEKFSHRIDGGGTRRSETSQYPEEKKSKRFPE
jgi:hypothetical protein